MQRDLYLVIIIPNAIDDFSGMVPLNATGSLIEQ